MRFIAGLFFCLWLGSAHAAAAEAPFHLHFLGPKAVASREDAGAVKQIFGLLESRNVGNHLLGEIAKLVAEDFATASATKAAPGLTAIFRNGLINEGIVEIADREKRQWRAALRLPKNEQRLWEETLRMLVKKHGGTVKSPVDARGSSKLTPKDSERSVLISHQGDWVFLDATAEKQPSAWLQATLKQSRPVPELDGLARIRCRSDFLSLLAPDFKSPRDFTLSLNLQFRNSRLRTEGTVAFDEPVNPPLEPFALPTNSIRDPLISFSALRGFRDWLSTWEELRHWRIPALPNQAFAWAEQDLPMHSLLAFPFPDAKAYLRKQTPRVLEALNPELAKRRIGQFAYDTNISGHILRGAPLMAPFVAPAPEASGNWAIAGTVAGNRPTGTNTNPPPAALLDQIRNRPDLIYYDWEVTEPRLQQVRMTVDLARIYTMTIAPTAGNPFPIWLKTISPLLGNTVTEIIRKSDRRWHITRTSDLGLSALELTLLSHRFAPVVKLAPPALPGR